MGTLNSKVMKYPGSWGLNTEETTLVDAADDETRYGYAVTNGVTDKTGKLVAREDFCNATTAFSNLIESLFTWNKTDGTQELISAAAGHLYTGLSTLTSRYDYSASTITSNSWQCATLGSNVLSVQAGVTPFLMHETYSNAGLSQASFTSPNVAFAGFGRLWVGDDAAGGNRQTLWWCKLLDAHNWGSGDAGSINLQNAWAEGQDHIVAGTAFLDRVVVFGSRQILMYTIPDGHDPTSMALAAGDIITNVGCVARDSVQATDKGIFFLSNNGIYLVDRLGQTTSLLTNKHVSQLYNQDVLDQIAAESNATLIRSAYYPKEGWYLLTFPTSNVTFCVHTRKPLPDHEGAFVTTKWTNTSRPWHAYAVMNDKLYAGMTNGIYTYGGYGPNTAGDAYSLVYTSQWLPFNDESVYKHPKNTTIGLTAQSGQTGTVTWAVDYVTGTTRSETFTCGAAEFAETPTGLGYVRVPLGGTFKVMQLTLTLPVSSAAVGIEQFQVFANPGKRVY